VGPKLVWKSWTYLWPHCICYGNANQTWGVQEKTHIFNIKLLQLFFKTCTNKMDTACPYWTNHTIMHLRFITQLNSHTFNCTTYKKTFYSVQLISLHNPCRIYKMFIIEKMRDHKNVTFLTVPYWDVDTRQINVIYTHLFLYCVDGQWLF